VLDGAMDRRIFLALGGSALLLPSQGFGASEADLKSDIAILREALTLHPGLYRYNSPAQMAARIDRLAIEFPRAPSLEARYLLLSRFLATIRCGHSYANFFNQKKAVAGTLFDRPTRVPFHFVWLGDQMIVTADHSGTGALPRGTRIMKLNGMAPSDMLRALLPYVRADGHNDAKRRSLLEVQGIDRIETFDAVSGLLFPPQGRVHRVEGVTPDGRRIRTDLPTFDLAQRRATMSQSPVKDDAPLWDWTMRPDGIAVLTMPDWGTYDSKWDWKTWLADRLNSLSGAKGLIVDIRKNEGGEDCGDPILARLATTDLRETGAQQKLRFQRTPASIDRYLDTWDDSFRTLGVGGAPLPGGFFTRPGASEILTIPAKGPRLTLPVAILTSAVNSSATFQFAQRAQQNRLAKLYGGTTGGNRRGINGGCFFFVRLPASGLEFDLPLVGYFPVGTQPDGGLAPDVRVVPTVRDIVDGSDRVMNRAISGLLYA
jgi:Peptidase family S41